MTKALSDASKQQIPRKWQWILLAPIAFHLAAVFSEPFHFFSRSDVQSSGAADANLLRGWLHPYAQWMYLDHGYFFFAPNPGPGHLLRIAVSNDPLSQASVEESKIALADGKTLLFPDRRTQFPRLLYHRYFMLSEFYYSRYAPVEITPELSRDPIFVDGWKRDRQLYTTIQDSVVSFAKNKTGKSYVRLDRLERELPDRASILQKGIRLTDSQWLSVLPESMTDVPVAAANNISNNSSPTTSRNPESVPAKPFAEQEKRQ